jgi:hypothetical protein
MVAPPRVVVDSPRLDVSRIEDMLRSTDPWLTPEVVAGFDEKDFSFLPDDERGRLARLVADFRAVAETVRPTGPAPRDAVERALPLFRDIVQSLEFDRYGDAEAFRLGKLIEREIAPHRPSELAELRFNTGLDHSGDPALWIWAFLSDEASDTDEHFLEAAQTLRDLLRSTARRVAPDRWPYISFRSLAEQLEPVEAS